MHNHGHTSSSQRIGWAFFLNLGFTLIEIVGGLLTNSTAIMADAVHDLGDCISIGLAWLLSKVSEKDSNTDFTYGYRRLSLLGALINGLVLIAGSAWVLSEAIPKLLQPEMPVVEGMLGLAIFGVMVNGFAAYKLSHGKTLNEKVLNWHLLEDVLGWVAVLIVSIVLLFVDWPILDPALSIVFTLYILFGVEKNLWSTTRLFLQAAPDKALSESLHQCLSTLDDVRSVHHLHLWSLDGEHHVLTAHLVLRCALTLEQQLHLKRTIADRLREFDLAHTTIEFEFGEEACRDAGVI
ncbi:MULTISPECIES: cation diffusion facilitator family transporter [Gammaproteobacteria]|uniref:cation diffusion facilitator family transporter n=1 Tax=Gammaproteobacteria TaxID=1236 RepID=UPI0007D03DB0|nr:MULTISPECIES: cation diffusion facilitator family transporter [Gammaproteobacteria]KZZ12266.1 cobalt transporter [Oleibacter sp. HI0075]MBN58507.1 cation transporter [Oceanospirillaceae bacterium]OUX67816.1 MAG: cation transporter [Oceanospirillaceae bacterium TMED276]HCG79654.1 cation transporter [Oceanospirillales bacterium]MAK42729.1 cation transporter [Spongiibacter sp.]|tara:strand:- start:3130 stop:4011 length:882 start_codon:yes stop_codon:yes gene_type:complete